MQKLPSIFSNLFIIGLLLFTIFTSACKTGKSDKADDSVFSRVLNGLQQKRDQRRFRKFYKKGVEKDLKIQTLTAGKLIKTAREYLGQKYVFGGLDSSKLVQKIFETHGIHLPRSAEEQARYGRIITDMNELKRGDLMFFIRTYRTYSYITHVAICLGKGEMLHAISPRVKITNYTEVDYWKKKFIFGTRLF